MIFHKHISGIEIQQDGPNMVSIGPDMGLKEPDMVSKGPYIGPKTLEKTKSPILTLFFLSTFLNMNGIEIAV